MQDTTSRRTEALPSPKSECAIFCSPTRTAARFQGLSAAAQPLVSKLQSPIFTGITGGPQGLRDDIQSKETAHKSREPLQTKKCTEGGRGRPLETPTRAKQEEEEEEANMQVNLKPSLQT
jgi:hypothetical protein